MTSLLKRFARGLWHGERSPPPSQCLLPPSGPTLPHKFLSLGCHPYNQTDFPPKKPCGLWKKPQIKVQLVVDAENFALHTLRTTFL